VEGKTEELLVKQHKSCERNKQEHSKSIKRSNLRLMGIEEGEEVQGKGMQNIFNKIITENFPNLKKELPIQERKPLGHQADLTKIEPLQASQCTVGPQAKRNRAK
jgi:hypothetical protein